MYLFKSSFLKHNGFYKDIDIREMKMLDVLEVFTDGYIELTHTVLTGEFYLKIEDLRRVEIDMLTNLSFHDWLSHNHNKELPAYKKRPTYEMNTIRYADAIGAGFDVNQVGHLLSLSANISKADKVNLLLDKNVANKDFLFKRMLVTVNGYLHRTFKYNDAVNVLGGGETFNNTGINTAGVLSFNDSCDLRQVEITDQLLTRTSSTTPLYEEVLINLGFELTGKSVMMSLGGHLILPGVALSVVNHVTGIIQLKIKKLDVVKMILNSIETISLDDLGVFKTDRGVTYNKVQVNELISDVVMKKYLLLKQSFVIVADCDHIEVDHDNVDITGLPGVYETAEEPVYPMMDSQGVISEYWKSRHEDYWSIRLTDDVTKRFMYKTNIATDNVIINGMSPTHKWYHDDPKFIKIKTINKL